MIQITYDRRQLSLSVKGHSGADVSGRDIICAGVSALVCSLGEAVRRLDMRGVLAASDVRLCHGDGVVRCVPQEGFGCLVRTVMDSFALGLELLAVEYPDYVVFDSVNQRAAECRPYEREEI